MAQNKPKLEDIIIQSFITNSTLAQSYANGTFNDPLNPTVTMPLPTQACKKNEYDPNNPPINHTKPIDGCNIAPPGLCPTGDFCRSPDFGFTGMYICLESAGTYCQRVCGSEKNLLYPDCKGGFYNTEVNCTNPFTDRTYIYQCQYDPYKSGQPQECTGHDLQCPTGNFHTKKVIECNLVPDTAGMKCGTQMTKKVGYICDQETGGNSCPTFDIDKCRDTKKVDTICKEDMGDNDLLNTMDLNDYANTVTGASPCKITWGCKPMDPINPMNEDGTWDFNWEPINF